MRTNIPITFHRETTTLGSAFEFAWQSLKVMESPLTEPSRADQTKQELARRIIATAEAGERDVDRLQEDAVAFVQAKYGF
jgi:hypothetical protein